VVFLSENIRPMVEQVHFQVYFPSFINTRYISISFSSTDGHIFSGAILCMKFNDFQAFLRKRREKALFMTSQCSQIRNNLRFFVLVYLAFILLSYNTDQAFIKAHFRPRQFLGLFMYTTVPCSLFKE
jgi:hypothetical protein